MKKVKIYGFLACVCLMMQSCLFNEDDVFDESSAQRAIASVEECQELLRSAENGWAMEYYTGTDAEYGGFNLYAKFGEQDVTMAADIATKNYAIGDVATSMYHVKSYQGTELSFDSYNELIHELCEPTGYNSPGYAGDYEFVFRSVSKDKIVLTGKKHGVTLIMTPLPADVDWKEQLTKIATVAENASYSTYKLIVNGQEVSKMGQEEHAFVITQKDATGEETVTLYPFMYTSEGVKMYEPFVAGGVAMSNFKWDNENLVYTCTDEGVDAKIEFYCPEEYLNYLGLYTLKIPSASLKVEMKQKKIGKSFAINLSINKGGVGVPIEFVFNYNVETGCIDVPSQVVGVYQGYDIMLYPGNTSGNFYPDDSAVFSGSIIESNPLTIGFTCKKYSAMNVMLLLYEKSDGWYGFTSLFQSMTLTKLSNE